MTDYEKTKIAITYRMLGAEWFTALKAMNFAKEYHNGLRKDGAPEFSHQIWIANHAVTLPLPKEKFDVLLSAIYLHDTCEDYSVLFEQVEQMFGREVRIVVENLTKVINNVKIPNDEYYEKVLSHPLSAIAKGCDRLHNLITMIKAFKLEKQKSYIEETLQYVIPMIKKARRMYPEYELAFESLKQAILGRISLIEEIHNAKNT